MSLPTFNFTVDANNAVRTNTYRTKSVRYGDGYKQLAPSGINNKLDTWDLTLPLLTASTLVQIEAFFDSIGQHQNFEWTSPHGSRGAYRLTSPIKYQASGLDRDKSPRTTVSLSIEKVFEYPSAPIQNISIVLASPNTIEGDSLTATITRSSTSELVNTLTVNFTVGGTATFGSDYTASGATTFTTTSGSIVIPANQLSATITLTSIADSTVEPDETVILTIVPVAGVSNGAGSVTWTINNAANNNTVLLLHFDGANGSTTIVDSSPINTSILSNIPLFSSVSKFGTASLGASNGGTLTLTNNSYLDNLLQNDFTIECFVRTLGSSGSFNIYEDPGKFLIQLSNFSSFAQVSVYLNGSSFGFITIANLPLSANFQHIALTRQGDVYRWFKNGVLDDTVSNSSAFTLSGVNKKMRNLGHTNLLIDEFRISKGIALYTANFTPTTAAFTS